MIDDAEEQIWEKKWKISEDNEEEEKKIEEIPIV